MFTANVTRVYFIAKGVKRAGPSKGSCGTQLEASLESEYSFVTAALQPPLSTRLFTHLVLQVLDLSFALRTFGRQC